MMERLNALLCERAEKLFATILAAESESFLKRFGHLRDELGRDAVAGRRPAQRARSPLRSSRAPGPGARP